MGSFPTSLSAPPPQPPDVTGQQGANPMSGLASMLEKKAGAKGGPPGDMESVSSVHPQGAMLALLETLKKAANQMAKMDERMGPFVNRAMSILEQGVSESVSKGKNSGSATEPGSGAGTGGGASSRAPSGEMSKGFPG